MENGLIGEVSVVRERLPTRTYPVCGVTSVGRNRVQAPQCKHHLYILPPGFSLARRLHHKPRDARKRRRLEASPPLRMFPHPLHLVALGTTAAATLPHVKPPIVYIVRMITVLPPIQQPGFSNPESRGLTFRSVSDQCETLGLLIYRLMKLATESLRLSLF